MALINASAMPLPVSRPSADGSARQSVIVYQQELLTALNSPQLLQDAVAIPGNGKLRMLRDRRNPAEWLKRRLEIKVTNPSIVSVTLTVPEYFQKDALEVVDYITLKCVSRTTVEVGRRTRKYVKSLRDERRSLNRQIDRQTAELQHLNRTWTSKDHPPVAALEAEIQRLLGAAGELQAEIRVAETADNSDHLKFVQMATATVSGQ